MATVAVLHESNCPVIAAVIPAYNEERFIGSVVISALQYAQHVIVVDDGSTDRTGSLARMAGADVVHMPRNGGKGLAMNAGFDRARRLGPDVVVMLDGDAQHDPAEIPSIVRPILDGTAEVVVGSRFLETVSDIPRWRRAGQHILTFVTNRTSGVRVTDSQSGFRAFSVRAIEEMRFHADGLALESEMQFLFDRSRLRVQEVPISVRYLDGNKRNPVVHGLQVLDAMLTLVARRRPLMFIGMPGSLLLALGAALGVFTVNLVAHHHAVPLGTTVLSALLIMAGLLMLMTSVLLNTIEHFMTRVRQEMRDLVGRTSGMEGSQ